MLKKLKNIRIIETIILSIICKNFGKILARGKVNTKIDKTKKFKKQEKND